MLATDDPFERGEQYQAQRGEWVVGGLETQVFWPHRAQLITFEGIEFCCNQLYPKGSIVAFLQSRFELMVKA